MSTECLEPDPEAHRGQVAQPCGRWRSGGPGRCTTSRRRCREAEGVADRAGPPRRSAPGPAGWAARRRRRSSSRRAAGRSSAGPRWHPSRPATPAGPAPRRTARTGGRRSRSTMRMMAVAAALDLRAGRDRVRPGVRLVRLLEADRPAGRRRRRPRSTGCRSRVGAEVRVQRGAEADAALQGLGARVDRAAGRPAGSRRSWTGRR